jgi:hypothetical protein
MEFTATHRAFLLNRHWVVYVNTMCPYHGNQTWTFEKFLDPGSDFKYKQDQTIEIQDIYISCSHFLKNEKTKRSYYFRSNNISLADAISALSSEQFFYTVYFNCKQFGRTTYRDLEKLDNREAANRYNGIFLFSNRPNLVY